jgi:rSAM/selenodomain-associated transferase 1
MRERARPLVFVMARAPVAGRVKTRLARGLGTIEATRRYRALLDATLRALSRDPRWRLIVAVTPTTSASARLWRRLAPGAEVVAQSDGGLGRRMAALLARAGPSPVAVVGSDIIDLRGRHVADALAALRGHDAVLAPAADGGFWLCAVRGHRARFPRVGEGAFAGIAWSRADTGAATRAALTKAGFRVGTGPQRADLDEA